MTVTFFGHRDAPERIVPTLETVVRDLIENYGADMFYVGNQGAFDRYVASCLKKLKTEYPLIRYYMVLAYMPKENGISDDIDASITLFPEELAKAMPNYAIAKRNDWMLNHSDLVVAYVTHRTGGAAKYYEKAIKKNKRVLHITT